MINKFAYFVKRLILILITFNMESYMIDNFKYDFIGLLTIAFILMTWLILAWKYIKRNNYIKIRISNLKKKTFELLKKSFKVCSKIKKILFDKDRSIIYNLRLKALNNKLPEVKPLGFLFLFSISIFICVKILGSIKIARSFCKSDAYLYIQATSLVFLTIISMIIFYKDVKSKKDTNGKMRQKILNSLAYIELVLFAAILILIIISATALASITTDYRRPIIIAMLFIFILFIVMMKLWKFSYKSTKKFIPIILTLLIYIGILVFSSIPIGTTYLITGSTSGELSRTRLSSIGEYSNVIRRGVYYYFNYPQENPDKVKVLDDLDIIEKKINDSDNLKSRSSLEPSYSEEFEILIWIEKQSMYLNKIEYDTLLSKLDDIKDEKRNIYETTKVLNNIRKNGLVNNGYQKLIPILPYIQFFTGLTLEWVVYGYVTAILLKYLEDNTRKRIPIKRNMVYKIINKKS